MINKCVKVLYKRLENDCTHLTSVKRFNLLKHRLVEVDVPRKEVSRRVWSTCGSSASSCHSTGTGWAMLAPEVLNFPARSHHRCACNEILSPLNDRRKHGGVCCLSSPEFLEVRKLSTGPFVLWYQDGRRTHASCSQGKTTEKLSPSFRRVAGCVGQSDDYNGCPFENSTTWKFLDWQSINSKFRSQVRSSVRTNVLKFNPLALVRLILISPSKANWLSKFGLNFIARLRSIASLNGKSNSYCNRIWVQR